MNHILKRNLWALLLIFFVSMAHALVNPLDVDPTIKIEDECARDMYLLVEWAADDLKAAHEELKSHGWGILILVREDAQERSVDSPSVFDRFSPRDRHKYGLAIDFTLYDINTGEAADMGTDFDTLKSLSVEELSEEIRLRRALLKDIMEKHRFEAQTKNWWHFDYRGWFQYCIIAACNEMNAHHLARNGMILAC